jgi:uncharacterized protein
VIALDTNVLVYARREESARHVHALKLVRQLAEGDAPWAIPWPCAYEYLRVVTHPRLFRPPSDLTKALDDLEALFDSPSLTLLGEGAAHRTHMRRMALAGRACGNLAHDAHIAALLREHGVREFWTNDRDFRRFPGIVVRDPFDASEVHETRVRYRARAAQRAR